MSVIPHLTLDRGKLQTQYAQRQLRKSLEFSDILIDTLDNQKFNLCFTCTKVIQN